MRPIRTPLCRTLDIGQPGSNVQPLPSWREDDETGHRVCSVWQPTQQERDAIAAGGNIILAVYADPIPPVFLGVGHGELFEPISAEEAAADHQAARA